MKKVFLFYLLFMITFSVFSQSSKTETDRKFSFQIDPLFCVLGFGYLIVSGFSCFMLDFEFQYALNSNFCLSVEPRFGKARNVYLYYAGSGIVLNGPLDGEFTSFTLDLGLLYKPFSRKLEGWYIGIYPITGWKNNTTAFYDNNSFIIGAKGGSGYQWIFRNGFTMTVGGAIGYTWDIGSKNNIDIVYGVYENHLSGGINFKLGYSF